MKHWCRYSSSCSRIASTTGPKRWPVFWLTATGEVDEAPPVDVDDARAVGVGDDQLRRGDPGADEAGAVGEDAIVHGDVRCLAHRGSMPQNRADFTCLLHAMRGTALPCLCYCASPEPDFPALRGILRSAVCRTAACPAFLPPRGRVPPTVLIVDDHPSFRASARAILEADGFEIVGEAEDGTTALEELRRLRPDMVLLDWPAAT